jgi:hypothetical protein
MAGVWLLITGLVAALWPSLVAYPIAALAAWLSLGLFVRARHLWVKGREAPRKTVAKP